MRPWVGRLRAVLAVGALALFAGAGWKGAPTAAVGEDGIAAPASTAPENPELARALTGLEMPAAPRRVVLDRAGPWASGLQGTAERPQQGYPQSASGNRSHDFFFTRAVHSTGLSAGFGYRGRGSWAVDWPKADQQFVIVLAETLDLLSVYPTDNPVRLDDPELRRYPFLYTLEVGGMALSREEAEGLRNYLLAGGFLVVDDFWGDWEWMNFESEMRRVLPEYPIEEIPPDHPIFHAFYDIEEILQVPSINNIRRGNTSECGPCQPQVRGIFDDQGRLMAIINWNTDLGDAWEWSEQAAYPFQYSNFAYKMAVNFIVYAMTH